MLRQLGVDVGHEEGERKFRLFSRDFEVFEIKLLVDSIQTSKFLPQEKTDALVKKLMKLCSRHERHKLERQVIVASRAKNLNTRIHYSMDEQTLKLFFAWIEEHEGITQVEAIRDELICNPIIGLLPGGKYTSCASDGFPAFPNAAPHIACNP